MTIIWARRSVMFVWKITSQSYPRKTWKTFISKTRALIYMAKAEELNVRSNYFYTCINRNSSVRIWGVHLISLLNLTNTQSTSVKEKRVLLRNVWIVKHHFLSNAKYFISVYDVHQFAFISLLTALFSLQIDFFLLHCWNHYIS